MSRIVQLSSQSLRARRRLMQQHQSQQTWNLAHSAFFSTTGAYASCIGTNGLLPVGINISNTNSIHHQQSGHRFRSFSSRGPVPDGEDNSSALKKFFELRRAANQKAQQQQQQQQQGQQQYPNRSQQNGQGGNHHRHPSHSNQYHSRQQHHQNKHAQYSQNNSHNGTMRRQQQHQQGWNQSDSNSSQHHYSSPNQPRRNQQQQQQGFVPRNSSQYNSSYSNQNRPQQQQNYSPQPNYRYGKNQQKYQQQQRGNRKMSPRQQEQTSQNRNRLADLIKQLRENIPKQPQSSSSEIPEGGSFKGDDGDKAGSSNNSNQRNKNQLRGSFQRPAFLQPSPSSWSSPSNFERTRNQAGSRNRQHLQRQQRQRGRNRGPVQRQTYEERSAENIAFLEGRLARLQMENDDTIREEQEKQKVTLPTGHASLLDASNLLRVKVEDIRSALQTMGVAVSDDMSLDTDLVELLAMEFGFEAERSVETEVVDNEQLLMQQRRVTVEDHHSTDIDSLLPPRPPVVCIMGHVDHGKTTLMDALRQLSDAQGGNNTKVKTPKKKSKKKKNGSSEGVSASAVAGTEAGGITQIISAFQVAMEGADSKITFLDTPGHAAFKSMRQSGSHAADVIVLVIAADDGVSEQTIEILDFYKSIVKGSDGGISMVIALNKIDKPGIDIDEAQRRIENQLLEQNIMTEGMVYDESEFGPPVQLIPTSGLTGLGLDVLMEGLLLQSEVMDLRADDQALGEGIVMDARLEKGLGVVADCIVRWGSLAKGDWIVSGDQCCRVRILKDVNDTMLKKGSPSQPVRIVGFKSLPKAGDPIMCVSSEKEAQDLVEQRLGIDNDVDEAGTVGVRNADDVELHINGMRSRDTRRAQKVHDLAGLVEGDGTIRIPIIVKASADGSLSAVRDSLVSLGESSSHEVLVDPILEGIGEITAGDIQMAKESQATIFAFDIQRVDQNILNLAEKEQVTIRNSDIIYRLLDDAKDALGKYLPQTRTEHVHGKANVQATFEIDGQEGKQIIAGLKVSEGQLYLKTALIEADELPCHFRVFRNGEQVSPEGEMVVASSLRHFKDLVESVRHGDECGLGLAGFASFEEGDVIECYSIHMKSSLL